MKKQCLHCLKRARIKKQIILTDVYGSWTELAFVAVCKEHRAKPIIKNK